MTQFKNQDQETVDSFGREWAKFNQSALSSEEHKKAFQDYFSIFPWESLPSNSEGLDVGCGSGRWATLVADRVGHLHCLDASHEALTVAKEALAKKPNVTFHLASVDEIPIQRNSLDFCYSLGVLHHVPDTAAAIKCCANVLKPGAPLLLYLYYALDNRPLWFKALWKVTDFLRNVISRLPDTPKVLATDLIALTIYWPLSRLSKVLSMIGMRTDPIPLAHYKDHSLYTLRTDARDRFGTPLEQRFSLSQITEMMIAADLHNISHSTKAPYWCVIGYKKSNDFQ